MTTFQIRRRYRDNGSTISLNNEFNRNNWMQDLAQPVIRNTDENRAKKHWAEDKLVRTYVECQTCALLKRVRFTLRLWCYTNLF